MTAEWTFRSGHVAGDAAKWLPLSAVRFTPRLGAASTAKAGKAFTVPFTIEGAATARTARKLAVTVSYDGGRTWKPAKIADRKRLELRHPAPYASPPVQGRGARACLGDPLTGRAAVVRRVRGPGRASGEHPPSHTPAICRAV